MKARVKATGEIVEVDQCSILYDDGRRELMYGKELKEVQGAPDYWDKLLHQYAGMAMQGMIRTVGHDRMYPPEKIAIYAEACAHALVQKLKEKEERK